jgi:tRNA dimethylallyltransferase
MSPSVVFILGCTGCGKAGLGRELARRTGAEILSVDSMKIYRGMDIGTAKPSPAVLAEIPHHCVNIVDPTQEFSVAEFVRHAEAAIADIHARGRHVLAVGGTALYIKGLVEGLFEGPSADIELRRRLKDEARSHGNVVLYNRLQAIDPVAAERIHVNDLLRLVRALEVYELTGTPISVLQTQWAMQRKRFDCAFIGLRRDPADQSRRINQRVHRMIDEGLVDEVESLVRTYQTFSGTAGRALGYAEILEYRSGVCSLAQAVEQIKINTRQFAKGQRTWFRRFREVDWIDLSPDDTATQVADELLDRRGPLWSP